MGKPSLIMPCGIDNQYHDQFINATKMSCNDAENWLKSQACVTNLDVMNTAKWNRDAGLKTGLTIGAIATSVTFVLGIVGVQLIDHINHKLDNKSKKKGF